MRRYLLLSPLLFLLILFFTPVGPWALLRLAVHLVPEWHVGTAGQSGALWGGFSFSELRINHPDLGLRLHTARLKVSLVPWALRLHQPKLYIERGQGTVDTSQSMGNAVELPLAFFPALDVEDGEIHYVLDEARQLHGSEWNARYRSIDDEAGALSIELGEWALVEADSQHASGALRARLLLHEKTIEIDSLLFSAQTDAAMAQLRARGSLGLQSEWTLDLQLDVGASQRDGERADDTSLNTAVNLQGGLYPLGLNASLRGVLKHAALDSVDWSAEMRVSPEHIAIDSLRATLWGGQVRGRADYAAASLEFAAQVKGVDLAHVDSALGGILSGDINARIDLDLLSYAGEVALKVDELAWADAPPFDVSLHVEHHQDGHTQVQLHSAPMDLHAVGHSDLHGDYALDVHGQLRPQAVFDGAIAALDLRGKAQPDSIFLQLNAAHLPGKLGRAFGPLIADLSLRQNRYLDVSASVEGSLLAARGAFDLQQLVADTLQVVVDGLSLAQVDSDMRGTLGLELVGAGPLHVDSLRLAGTLAAQQMGYNGWNAGDLSGDLRWQSGRGQLHLLGEALEAALAYDAQGGELDARMDFKGDILRGPNTGDSLALVGQLQWLGALAQPQLSTGQLQLDSLVFKISGLTLENTAPLHLSYASSHLALDRVELSTPLGPVYASGFASVDSLALEVQLPLLSLGLLVPQLNMRQGAGHFSLQGSIAKPQLGGWVELSELALDTLLVGDVRAELTLRDSLHLHAVLEREARREMTLDVTSPAAALWAGKTDSTALLRLQLALDQLSLQAPLSYALAQPVRGALSLRADVSLPLSRTDSAFSWSAFQGELAFLQLDVAAEVDGDSLVVELAPGAHLHAEKGDVVLDSLRVSMSRYDRDAAAWVSAGQLVLAGRLPAVGEADLRLGLHDVDLVFFGGPEGAADLQVQVAGTAHSPRLRAELEVDAEDLGFLQGDLRGDRSGADLHLHWETLVEDSLVVQGHLPWDLDAGRIAWKQGWLKAHSEGLGLFIFSDLLTNLDYLDGFVGLDIEARGLDSTLALVGQVDFEDMEFALVDIEPVYALPTGSLVFSGRRGELRGFSTEEGSTYERLALGGYVDFASIEEPHFDVSVSFAGLDCRYEDIFRADDIDAALRLAGTPTASRLSGSISLQEPLAEPVLVVLNAPPAPPPPSALRDEFLENMALDVRVDLRGLKIDSELAEAVVSGGIGVGGTFYKPVFQGDAIIEEGKVFILSRQFDFEQSRIVLNSLVPTRSILDVAYDPLELDPDLDLRATTKVLNGEDGEEYTVTMKVQGAAKSAVPRFESIPARSFSDIISLLAFGTTSSSGGYRSVLGTVAGQLLSKQVEKVGIDEFTVLPSSSVIGIDPKQPALRMGKFIEMPFPMWVRYEAAVNRMAQGEVRLEHRLNSYLTITGSAQSEYNRYGLGIGLKRDF